MRVLDLFCGLGGWSTPFLARGHDVVTLDINPAFCPDITGDFFDPEIREMASAFGPYDLIVASPPCETFSVASIGTHWTGGKGAYETKTEAAARGIRLLEVLVPFCFVEDAPFVIENPRGLMRKMPWVSGLERRTVTYCQYGQSNMKPTDLFGTAFQRLNWEPKPPCKNGDPCHERAPRGARTGTQGIKGYAERSKIPYKLALELCLTAEVALDSKGKWPHE